MKYLHYVLFVSLLFAVAVCAQNSTPTNADERSPSAGSGSKRGPVFRANKEQITSAQTMLKTKGLYTGDATGKLDEPTRDAIKSYQKSNGLRSTGSLNRATLEKMGIGLTDKQKAIPASANSYASASTGSGAKRGPVFRATKEQISEAQRLLKTGGMYAGDQTGKLDDPTRSGLKKYQEANGLKVTGTLNQATLEKMGITLTEKQKAIDGTR